jgi:hypothetical protein
MTRDGHFLRESLKGLADKLAPKGFGEPVPTDTVIAAWANDAANNKGLVAAHRRARASHCTTDKRMCAFFAELAPGVATVELTPSEAYAKPTTTGRMKVPRSESAIRVQMGKLSDIISQLGIRMREYEAKYEALKSLMEDDEGLTINPKSELCKHLKRHVPVQKKMIAAAGAN